jgi:hypothetical protein
MIAGKRLLEIQAAFKKICPKIPGIFVHLMVEPWNLEKLDDELIQDILDEKVELDYQKQLVNVSDKKVRKKFNGSWVNVIEPIEPINSTK